MNTWKSDVKKWAKANDRDPSVVEGILVKNGWVPAKYTASMKEQLNYYLDQWYTLSVKTLPKPATNNKRRNPSHRFTLETPLESGWVVLTESNKSGNKFRTLAFNEALQISTPQVLSRSRTEAFLFHDGLAEDLAE